MNTDELVSLLRSTHKFVKRCLCYDSCISDSILCDLQMTLDMICASAGSWKGVVDKYMDERCIETFQVPFQLALGLVAGRRVRLDRGLASVSFSRLHVVLASLSHAIITRGLATAASRVHYDKRTVLILNNLQAFGRRLLGKPALTEGLPVGTSISHADVDNEMSYFPPCMKHLHRTLRQRHRLRHHSRIQYTLFLKEVGLPLQEALLFWRREYSQPQLDRAGKAVRDAKSWQKDKRRYTYSIRHLYGQEGSRVNYSAHSCKYLQTYTPGPGEEGGCPFSQADSSYLQKLMDIEDIRPPVQSHVQSLSEAKQYSQACLVWHRFEQSQLCDETGASSSVSANNARTLLQSRHLRSDYADSNPSSRIACSDKCGNSCKQTVVTTMENSKQDTMAVHRMEDKNCKHSTDAMSLGNMTATLDSGAIGLECNIPHKSRTREAIIDRPLLSRQEMGEQFVRSKAANNMSLNCAMSTDVRLKYVRTNCAEIEDISVTGADAVRTSPTVRTQESAGISNVEGGKFGHEKPTLRKRKLCAGCCPKRIELRDHCECAASEIPSKSIKLEEDPRTVSEDHEPQPSRVEQKIGSSVHDDPKLVQDVISIDSIKTFGKPVDIYRSFKKLLLDLGCSL